MTATALPLSAPARTPSTSDGALLPVYKRFPVEFVSGAGVELFDASGRAYLDFTSGIAVNALGYDDAGVRAAMLDALDSGVLHLSNLYHSAPGARLAQRLADLSGLSAVFFCNSGAEANEGAFKFARRWARAAGGPAKHEILAVRGSFHGRLFGTLAATDRPQYRAPFRPLAGGISVVERDLDALDTALDPERVAAVILEPVQGEGGVRVLEPAFLRAVRAMTRERGVALILDEIQCGLGRTGRLFAFESSEIRPDLVTLAKPLAGGLPMGAILMSSEIADSVSPGDHGSTFGGGPFVSSVALHVVGRLSDPTLLSHVRETGQWFGAALRQLASRRASVRAVRGIGYIWGLDVHAKAADIAARALEAGLLICSAGEHTLRLLPPLVATRADLARGIAILDDVLD